MPASLHWFLLAISALCLISVLVGLVVSRFTDTSVPSDLWEAIDQPRAGSGISALAEREALDETLRAEAVPTTDSPRVLVAEDDPGLRTLLRTTFSGAGLVMREADSAERAASIVRGWQPDLVIVDVGLSGL